MTSSGTEAKPSGKFTISRSQIVVLGLVLILIGAFLSGRQFGWLGISRSESVAIPSDAPYAEARVVGAYEGVVLANRIARPDAARNESHLPKLMEILTDEKTVFARITASGPVKIAPSELAEGSVIWVYKPVPTLGEALAGQSDSSLALPLGEAIKNPRERIRAEYVVLASGK